MKLFEEFKEYENLWESATTDAEANTEGLTDDASSELTEGIGKKAKDFVIGACLKLVNNVEIDRKKFTGLLQDIVKMSGWDTDRYAERPYYFTGAIIADMMEADLNRLSIKDWVQKWTVEFFEEGSITFDPADYPNIWLEGFKDWEERPIELSFVI
jgi:hypothetical protein